jgi:predicted RNase H-like HicB family nuclease
MENRLIFWIEEAEDGGFTAKSEGIFTEAETISELYEAIKEAIICHFEKEEERPREVELKFIKSELLVI